MYNRPISNFGSELRFKRRHWVFGTAIAAGVASILWVTFSLRRDRPTESSAVPAAMGSPVRLNLHDLIGDDEEILTDPRFTVTSNRPPPFVRMPIPGMTKAKRLEYELRWKLQTPRPENSSFPPSPMGPHSIHGILSQCTEVTGIRFLIAKNVVAGAVDFGHTNTLNGRQWAQAFTDVLRTKYPDWPDFGRSTTRRENLVLLTRNGKNVLVLPEEMASEFRFRGFKDFTWNFEE